MQSLVYYKTQEFVGLPESSDFKIVEETVATNLRDGEIITEAIVISVDPFTRVLESRNEKYPKGSTVMHRGGWKTICKCSEQEVWYRVDEMLSANVSVSATVGVLGMPGLSAYFALLDGCNPQPGETVMINGCAGAVGNVVGQIAKLKGCRVVGCCGSDKKCEFAKSIGYDDVFNYKTADSWKTEIFRIAPKGIDCFFDNVGGQLASDIITSMNPGGRIVVCGAISTYNEETVTKVEPIQMAVLRKLLTMKGFAVDQFRHEFPGALKDILEWIAEGKITIHQTVTEGFENTPKAFIEMLTGKNIGKAVVNL